MEQVQARSGLRGRRQLGRSKTRDEVVAWGRKFWQAGAWSTAKTPDLTKLLMCPGGSGHTFVWKLCRSAHLITSKPYASEKCSKPLKIKQMDCMVNTLIKLANLKNARCGHLSEANESSLSFSFIISSSVRIIILDSLFTSKVDPKLHPLCPDTEGWRVAGGKYQFNDGNHSDLSIGLMNRLPSIWFDYI